MTNARSLGVPAALTLGLLATSPLGCGGGESSPDAFVTPSDDAFVVGADTGPQPDAFSAEDAFTETPDAGASPDAFEPAIDAGMMASCGGMRPDITGVTGTEGLVIGRDGAIYYSQRGAVGRIGTDGVANDAFVALPRGATQVWGMVPDAANEHLYVGSPSTGAIYDVDLTAVPPTATTLVSGVGGPNGLTLGPDGALYFSDFSGGRVMRVELTAGATPTVVASLRSANGVAFDDAGRLLVCNYGSGELVRLTLAGGVEMSREIAASGLGSPDGVALDRDGTLYVTDNGGGRLLRVEADGSVTPLLTGVSAAASLEFGAGVLDCEDLYVASGRVLRRYEMGTVPGRAVPWH